MDDVRAARAGHDDGVVEPRYRCGQPVERAAPEERLQRWRRTVPAVETDFTPLQFVVRRSAEDLGALRIFDPEYPERAVVAAGAPWFMTLFGRDSLLTSWMALLVDPDLALGVLQTLARFQGTDVDPITEEEPGRILHEMRFGEAPSLSLGGGRVYYGTADATPLFVMLLGELRRWGLAREVVDSLLPAADRAMEWIEHFGDRDGDGYVEYQRTTDRGLRNQGWKDSWDGIRFADGRLGQTADRAVRGAGLRLRRVPGPRPLRPRDERRRPPRRAYRAKARELKTAFNRDFWLEEQGWFAMGLDARQGAGRRARVEHRPLPVDRHRRRGQGAARRRRGCSHPRCSAAGACARWRRRWPATTRSATTTARCGRTTTPSSPPASCATASSSEAHRVIMGLLDAAAKQGGRLPELFAGLGRDELPFPVSYPTSCSPQAWAAAAPLSFLRTILRLDPWVPHGKVWLDPVLPQRIGYLRVDRIPLAGSRVTVEVDHDEVKVEGLPPDLELIRHPRQPLTA